MMFSYSWSKGMFFLEKTDIVKNFAPVGDIRLWRAYPNEGSQPRHSMWYWMKEGSSFSEVHEFVLGEIEKIYGDSEEC